MGIVKFLRKSSGEQQDTAPKADSPEGAENRAARELIREMKSGLNLFQHFAQCRNSLSEEQFQTYVRGLMIGAIALRGVPPWHRAEFVRIAGSFLRQGAKPAPASGT